MFQQRVMITHHELQQRIMHEQVTSQDEAYQPTKDFVMKPENICHKISSISVYAKIADSPGVLDTVVDGEEGDLSSDDVGG